MEIQNEVDTAERRRLEHALLVPRPLLPVSSPLWAHDKDDETENRGRQRALVGYWQPGKLERNGRGTTHTGKRGPHEAEAAVHRKSACAGRHQGRDKTRCS